MECPVKSVPHAGKNVSEFFGVGDLRFNLTHLYGSRLHDDKGLGLFGLDFLIRATGASASTQKTSGNHLPVANVLGRLG